MKTIIKIFSFLLFLSPLFPQQLYEEQIIPFDGLDSDHFGSAVAVSDSFLFISSLRYSDHTQNSVYVYRLENNSYSFLYKIYPSDTQSGTNGALFGVALLYSDGQLFVGARNRKINNIPIGAVYLFEYEDYHWVEKQIILPPQPFSFGSWFSSFISKSNDYLLIGANRYDSEFESSGKAFLYKFINNQYELYHEFSPFDAKEDQHFGSSGIIKDNTILIGSPLDSTKSGIYSGSVYVYFKEDSLWTFNQKYVPEPNSEYFKFGSAMAANDDYVFIGKSDDNPGKVYVYNYYPPLLDYDQFIETGDNFSGDLFGVFMFPKGDSLLVGAFNDTVKNDLSGAAYLFVNKGERWEKKHKIYPSDEVNTRTFGYRGIITEDKIFIGALGTKVNNIRSGAVYVYASMPLSVDKNYTLNPKDFYLSQNYPNPFNPTTNISYSISQRSFVTLKIYDVLGNEVTTLINKEVRAGSYEVEFDANNLPSGIYFYQIRAGAFVDTKKLVLMK
ncbi:MAG: T9SS type A sorting domain-containing protein [Bacteroidetes bacterium]|nr:T9SS type A sorting domain-containing protein [Bacteroidota bacterium]